MTKKKPKDSLVWLEELVEAAKKWRVTMTHQELPFQNEHGRALAAAVDGYQQAIKDEVEAELDKEESSG